jgi:hypothetical protein
LIDFCGLNMTYYRLASTVSHYHYFGPARLSDRPGSGMVIVFAGLYRPAGSGRGVIRPSPEGTRKGIKLMIWSRRNTDNMKREENFEGFSASPEIVKAGKVETTTEGMNKYTCPVCGTQHLFKGDFVVCCLPPSFDMWKCGQCSELFFNKDKAKDCCNDSGQDESKFFSGMKHITPEHAKTHLDHFIEWFNKRGLDEFCLEDAKKQYEFCEVFIKNLEGTLEEYWKYKRFLEKLINSHQEG